MSNEIIEVVADNRPMLTFDESFNSLQSPYALTEAVRNSPERMYELHGAIFEAVGVSWVKHGAVLLFARRPEPFASIAVAEVVDNWA